MARGAAGVSVITEFEQTILDALLAGPTPELTILRRQLELASVAQREMTGVGFFTTFSIPAIAPRLALNGRKVLSDIHAEIEGVSHGAGFLLFIQDGRIDFLEGVTYGEPWPESVRLRSLTYLCQPDSGSVQQVQRPERDLARVTSLLAG